MYIVEGQKREINLLGDIFKRILHYKEIYAVDREGVERIKYVSEENSNSKIFIINSEKSNIQSIANIEFIDRQVEVLKQYVDEFNYEDIPIYYLFDCDRENDQNKIESLIDMFGNSREPSRENQYDSIGGMLLLSYPAIESFVISNFEKDMLHFHENFDFECQTLKKYIGDCKYNNEDMSKETLANAFRELIKSLDYIGEDIHDCNLDDISQFSKNIFEHEKEFKNQYMLSLLLISFMDLGIIELI